MLNRAINTREIDTDADDSKDISRKFRKYSIKRNQELEHGSTEFDYSDPKAQELFKTKHPNVRKTLERSCHVAYK